MHGGGAETASRPRFGFMLRSGGRILTVLAAMALCLPPCAALEITRGEQKTESGATTAALTFSTSAGGFKVYGVKLQNGAPVMPAYCAKSGREYPDVVLLSSAAYRAAENALKTGRGSVTAAAVKNCAAQNGGLCLRDVRALKNNRLKVTAVFDGAAGLELRLLKVESKKRKSYWRMYPPDSIEFADGKLRETVRALAIEAAEKFRAEHKNCPQGRDHD